MQTQVFDVKGKSLNSLELPETIFGVAPRPRLLHEVVVGILTNRRAGSASTKTRAEVSGGGHKPWKQKHTGRARSGSTRSPLWRHGGIAFGPRPRDWHTNIPEHKRRLAMLMALSLKAAGSQITVLDNLDGLNGKTKNMAKLLKRLDAVYCPALLILDQTNDLSRRAVRNIKNLDMKMFNTLDAYSVMRAKRLIFTVKAIELLSAQNIQN